MVHDEGYHTEVRVDDPTLVEDCTCGDGVPHQHLSMPDPPGTTRLELIYQYLREKGTD